jgi:glycosyltransferase involved in cell wall biosynthesis
MSMSDADGLTPGSVPIAVVLPVLDEERNIAEALRSVGFAAEVFVVDSGSRDRTCDIAREHGAEVVHFDFRRGGPKKKAWALRSLPFNYDWVLFLDGDERVPPALAGEIAESVERNDMAGYHIDREMIFLGKPLRSYRPDWNLRLFRHKLGAVEDLGLHHLPNTGDNEIHEHFEVSGHIGYLKVPLEHRDYRGIGPWVDRHNRYATWEAHLYMRLRDDPLKLNVRDLANPVSRNRMVRRAWVRLPGRPLLRTLGWLIGKRSFRDGATGFRYALLMGWYEMLIGLRVRELEAERDARQG